MASMQTDILVLALGNLLMRDDGLGICALTQLQDCYDLPPHVRCVDGGVLGLELLAHVADATHLLAIDAVRDGQAPGSLVRLEGDAIPKRLSLKLSMHQVSFADILALSQLRGTVPPRMVVWGLVPAVMETGVGLSPEVEARLGSLVEAVVDELRQWGVAAQPKPTAILGNLAIT
jgi:hydrogenase maturation protease